MMETLNQSILSQYSDGSKCREFISDLVNSDAMTWEAVYWRVKYLFEFAGDMCPTEEMIKYVNECFNQGLSVNTNQSLYIDARRMAAVLYNKAERYELAANCIQVVLDITEDVPVDMLLDLNYAQVHTDTLRTILKNSSLFFNDLHMADGRGDKYVERQKAIIRDFLFFATDYKIKNPVTPVNIGQIESEVINFGLNSSDEWNNFKRTLDAVESGTKPQLPIIRASVKPKTEDISKITPKTNPLTMRKEKRPIEIPIFPEEDTSVKKGKEEVSEQESPKQESTDFKAFESMFASLMGMVKQNTEQIATLQGKLGESKDASEAARIEAELEEGTAKNKELLGQLEAAQAKLALSEEQKESLEQQKKTLEKTVAEQTLIIDEKRSAQFKDADLKAFEAFERVIMFDTCSIENELELLEYVQLNEMVRVSQIVIDELENHKKNGDTERKKIGQRALKAIRRHKYSIAFDYEYAYPLLLPKAYQIKEEDNIGTKNDKYIFSAALRYKINTTLPVVLISDDVTVQEMAISEHIETMAAAEFISGREKYIPSAPVVAPLTEEEYLARKIKPQNCTLTMKEILVLQSYKIFTYGDFINTAEDTISFMKDKRGINLGSRFLPVHKKIKADYERKYKPVIQNSEDAELLNATSENKFKD